MIFKLISLSLFLILLAVGIYKTKGIPTCISAIYYKIGYWFTLLLGVSSLSIMPYIVEVTPETYKFTGFLFCTSLMFVAFAPNFNDKFEGQVHSISAFVSAFFAFVWALCISPLYLLSMLVGIFGTIINKQNWLWWCEISMFLLVYLILFTN